MISAKLITIFGVAALIASARADSAGIVEMTNGLAYGGIPYGTVSGMLAKYQNPVLSRNYYQQLSQYPYTQQRPQPQTSLPIIITPNFRAAGLAQRSTGPVQIYKLTGVVAPGVVGTFSQIGY